MTGDPNKVGLVTLIAGFCFVVGAIGSEIVDPLWLVLVLGFALLIYAVPALHRYQAPADGAAGKWGARLVPFGGAVLIALALIYLVWEAVGNPPEEGPAWTNVAWPIGFFSFLIGIVAFAIGTIRAKVFPTAAATLILVGLVAGVAIDMATGTFFEDDGESTAWGFMIGIPLAGLGIAWLGNSLRTGQTKPASGEAAAPPV